MAEMTMISMAVMAATQQSRSFLEAAAGRKDLYLEEGPLEEGTLEIGTLGIGTLEKADVIYLPDYSSLDFRQVRKLLKTRSVRNHGSCRCRQPEGAGTDSR